MLCGLLSSTGVAGQPGSHFHVPSLAGWLSAYDLEATAFATQDAALRAVMAAALQRGTAGTAQFGLRLQRDSFAFFIAQLDRLFPGQQSDAGRIEAAFGHTRFVYLTRQDKVAQAVSLLKARQTGLWHRNADGSDLERVAPPKEPRYDHDAIAASVAHLSALDASWQRWFADEGLRPLRVSYEDLALRPNTVLADVLIDLGHDPSLAATVDVPTAKLADAESVAWIDRYRRMLEG